MKHARRTVDESEIMSWRDFSPVAWKRISEEEAQKEYSTVDTDADVDDPRDAYVDPELVRASRSFRDVVVFYVSRHDASRRVDDLGDSQVLREAFKVGGTSFFRNDRLHLNGRRRYGSFQAISTAMLEWGYDDAEVFGYAVDDGVVFGVAFKRNA